MPTKPLASLLTMARGVQAPERWGLAVAIAVAVLVRVPAFSDLGLTSDDLVGLVTLGMTLAVFARGTWQAWRARGMAGLVSVEVPPALADMLRAVAREQWPRLVVTLRGSDRPEPSSGFVESPSTTEGRVTRDG